MAEERVVGENEWGQVTHHPSKSVLELAWRGGVPMTDAAFMATLHLLALTAERILPAAILVDATDFRHEFGAGVMEWRNQTVIPRYGAAGVRRFGFVMPEGFPRNGTEAVDGPAVFPTAWFGRREDAFDWLVR